MSPVLGSFPTIADGSPMDASDLSDVFLKTGAEGGNALANIVGDIDKDNLSAAPAIPESLLQFFAFLGTGGHDHSPSGDGRLLENDTVRTEQVDEDSDH